PGGRIARRCLFHRLVSRLARPPGIRTDRGPGETLRLERSAPPVMDLEAALHTLGVAVLAFPALLLAILGVLAVLDVRPSELFITRVAQGCISLALLPALCVLTLMLWLDNIHVSIMLSEWVVLPGHGDEPGYKLVLKIVFDRLSTA